MEKGELQKLFGEFLVKYDVGKHEAVWKRQSEIFRQFWSDKILNTKSSIVTKAQLDSIICILDAKARGHREFKEAGGEDVARTMITQIGWYGIFESLKNKSNIQEIMDALFNAEDDEQCINLINQLEKVNEINRNRLTGRRACALNTLLFAYHPERYLSMVSLKHRLQVIKYLELGDSDSYENLSYGERIIRTNRDILSKFKEKYGIETTPRTLTRFLYSDSIWPIWRKEDGKISKGKIGKKEGKEGPIIPIEEKEKITELIKEGKSLREIKKITSIKRKLLKPIYEELATEGLIPKQVKNLEEDMFEETEIEQPLTIPPEARNVIWQPKDYSIRELFEMYKDGELHLQPRFQRFFVWDDKKSSRLIESIFLNVPIPVIYLAEEEKGTFTVIDGQQRLRSFFNFMDGELKLKSLLVTTEINGKYFADLTPERKSNFKKATIHTIVVKPESHRDIRFEIYVRLNTGSVQLNDQELRNCMFRGEYNELLEDLAKDKTFLSLLGLKESHKRMMDRELILRFFAFYHSTYLRYEPPMKAFLNNEMRKFVSLDETETEKLRKLFKKSVDLIETVFGENSFRRFIPGSETDPNGVWERRKINKALFDIVMYGFTDYEKHQIVPKSDAIREELIWLMTHDQGFIDSIMFGTSDKSKVLTRFEKWLKNLREIVGYPQKEPRAFSLELKAELHRSNPTCRICGQRIQVLDDSEVDHIDFYWRGGKTTPSNARLVHRYCNRQRGGRD
jgi:hypothetical protein